MRRNGSGGRDDGGHCACPCGGRGRGLPSLLGGRGGARGMRKMKTRMSSTRKTMKRRRKKRRKSLARGDVCPHGDVGFGLCHPNLGRARDADAAGPCMPLLARRDSALFERVSVQMTDPAMRPARVLGRRKGISLESFPPPQRPVRHKEGGMQKRTPAVEQIQERCRSRAARRSLRSTLQRLARASVDFRASESQLVNRRCHPCPCSCLCSPPRGGLQRHNSQTLPNRSK